MFRVGRFEIQSEIGSGTFGRVFRAYDPQASRPVALKLFYTDHTPDAEFSAAAGLAHKNIVTVYEHGMHEGRPYIAMQLLEGETLQQIIGRNAPFSIVKRLDVLIQGAEGLAHAHKHGVIHRVLDPAHFMLQPDGTVKITAFATPRTHPGAPGNLIYTARYMAPEQVSGSDVDVLCNIFSYGVILYELIAYRHPFEAVDSAELLRKIRFDEVPLIRSLVPDCPEALQQVISRLLQKDRERRYPSLIEAQVDIEAIRWELNREHAGRLLDQSRDLFEKKELEGARAAAVEVLKLDPANRQARPLLDAIRSEQRRREVQSRIESLQESGDEHLANRRFSEAVLDFEAALRLDRSNADIQSRLETAHDRLAQCQRAAHLLAEARAEFERQDLSRAREHVDEALRRDPQSTEAVELLRKLEYEINTRQRDQRAHEAMQKAKALLELNALDQAMAVLADLGDPAERPETQPLLEEIRARRLEQEKRQYLQNGLARVSGLLRDQRFDAALRYLEALEQAFPHNEELVQLRSLANSLANASSHEQARMRYPGERELELQRKRAEQQRPESEKQEVARAEREAGHRARYEAALAEAEQLSRTGDSARALEILRQILSDGAPDNRAALLLQRLVQEKVDDRTVTREVRIPEELRATGLQLTPAAKIFDDNVQFTAFRPKLVSPEQWAVLLVFAHLSARPADAPKDMPDPVQEVSRQARQILGEQIEKYQELTQDSAQPLPRAGELIFIPEVPGIEFNPRRASFLWQEAVHRVEFRLRASRQMDGQVARGRISVFLGSIIVAQIALSIRIDSASPTVASAPEAVTENRYRKIFASYSHKDQTVVEEFELYARALGDEYLRDVVYLRSGEVWNDRLLKLIQEANVFQLFWSSNSMRSDYVAQEWRYALSLQRQHFVRPVYWEDPLPAAPELGLPPEELRALHFCRVSPATRQKVVEVQIAEMPSDSTLLFPAPPEPFRRTAPPPKTPPQKNIEPDSENPSSPREAFTPRSPARLSLIAIIIAALLVLTLMMILLRK